MHHLVHKRFADIERLELYNLFMKRNLQHKWVY